MDRPMQGGGAPADMGLFDGGARMQGDMFDPDSPAFSDRLDAASQNLRTEVEAEDFEVSLVTDDGRTMKKASDALEYLDDVEGFALRVELCGKVT